MNLQKEVKYLDHQKELIKDSDQPLEKDSICDLPHSSTAKDKPSSSEREHGTELVITVNPIEKEGDEIPEKGKKERKKSPTKRLHSAPVEAGLHKKTKKPDPP